MNKIESMAILLACRKNGIYMSSRNERDDYLVGFFNRLEVRSFEAAKLITNGLVIETRLKKQRKIPLETDPALKPDLPPLVNSNSKQKKYRGDSGITLEERMRTRRGVFD
jgi:hypothetical protein